MPQVRVFQCPNCHEYIATDAKNCRFCSAPITPEVAQADANAQAIDNRKYRRKRYAVHMLSGAGLFVLGVGITAVTFLAASASEGGGYYVVTWGFILAGAGNFLYGLFGWLSELKKSEL